MVFAVLKRGLRRGVGVGECRGGGGECRGGGGCRDGLFLGCKRGRGEAECGWAFSCSNRGGGTITQGKTGDFPPGKDVRLGLRIALLSCKNS